LTRLFSARSTDRVSSSGQATSFCTTVSFRSPTYPGGGGGDFSVALRWPWPPSRAEVENAWSCDFTSPYPFMAWCLMERWHISRATFRAFLILALVTNAENFNCEIFITRV
jgi:hypothetical protein